MIRISPLAIATAAILHTSAYASVEQFFEDSTVDLKWKVNYYNIEGEGNGQIPVTGDELAALTGIPSSMLPDSVMADIETEMSIKDFGTSAWINWRSGWLFDHIGVELEYQGAGLFDQSGEFSAQASALGTTLPAMTADNPYFYGADADETYVGKLGNANLRLKMGETDSETQLVVGRFTPTIYNLLHRPDEIYYGMHQVYEGASIQGNYQWSWGMIQPWINYFTGYSNEWNEDTVNFKDDLNPNSQASTLFGPYLSGSFDEIYNVGFHTVTDYYTSSASWSYAEDYLSNGIIEIYSGIPYSLLGWGDESEDGDYYIKYMGKYGFEKGKGVNSEHKTDVWEFAIGVQHGNFDILTGVTQIGDETFAGFETQDGMTAGGGTAVWGDVAILNKFDQAGQRTYFAVGGYNLDGWNLPSWRVQGVYAMARDTDLSKLTLMERLQTPNEDYYEMNLDIIYAKNGYQGEGMSYLLKLGKDNNFDGFGFGFFVEYNGDITQLVR